MIRIYGTPMTRAIRPLWLLEELGVPYELVKTDFAGGATRTSEFLKINPNGHVPALVDGDLVLFESMAINLYLAEKYGKGTLWPGSEHDRARTVQWSFWAITECERTSSTRSSRRAVHGSSSGASGRRPRSSAPRIPAHRSSPAKT